MRNNTAISRNFPTVMIDLLGKMHGDMMYRLELIDKGNEAV
jgi:hypothetical protein